MKFRGVSRRNRNTWNAKYFNEKRNLPFFLREKKLSVLRETIKMLLKLYRDCILKLGVVVCLPYRGIDVCSDSPCNEYILKLGVVFCLPYRVIDVCFDSPCNEYIHVLKIRGSFLSAISSN